MDRVRIQYAGPEGCGWFVQRESVDPHNPDYLHSDGVWRKDIFQTIDGQKVFTGCFPTKEEAEYVYGFSLRAVA